MLATGLLAQSVNLNEAPTSVVAALFLVIVALLTGMLRTPGDYHAQRERADKQEQRADRLEERGDRLEQAIGEERKALLVALEISQQKDATIRELTAGVTVIRQVLESWPAPDPEPPTRPPPRRRPA